MAENQDRIREILAELQQPQAQPGLLQRIIDAVQRSVAIGFSPQPGQAVQADLAQQQQLIQIERERQERTKLLGAQLSIEDILQRGKEKREEERLIEREKRTEEFKIGEEKRALDREVELFNLRLGGEKQLRDIDKSTQKELFQLKLAGDKELGQINQGYAQELKRLESSLNNEERDRATNLQLIAPLLLSGVVNPEQAGNIRTKIRTNQTLEPEEIKLIQKARKALADEEVVGKIRVAIANNQGGAGTKFQEDLLKAALVGARSEEMAVVVDTTTGQRRLVPYRTNEFGAPIVPPNTKFVELADYITKAKQILDDNIKVQEFFKTGTTGRIEVPDDKAAAIALDQIIGLSRSAQLTDAQIILNRDLWKQKYNLTDQQINDAITRNKVNPQQAPAIPPSQPEIDIMRRLEEGDITALKEAEERSKASRAKVEAAKTVTFLTSQLGLAKDQLTQRPQSAESLKKIIKDLERRLEDAFKANPDLRPKK